MSAQYLIILQNNQKAANILNDIMKKTLWRELGVISNSLPLLSTLSICENIMLPLLYSERMSRVSAEPIVQELLKKFSLEEKMHDRPKKLNEYEKLIVKFLRAIMLCPKRIVFILPHVMLPAGEYQEFVAFAATLADFDTTIIEHSSYAAEFFTTNYTEISYNKWVTHVLNI